MYRRIIFICFEFFKNDVCNTCQNDISLWSYVYVFFKSLVFIISHVVVELHILVILGMMQLLCPCSPVHVTPERHHVEIQSFEFMQFAAIKTLMFQHTGGTNCFCCLFSVERNTTLTEEQRANIKDVQKQMALRKSEYRDLEEVLPHENG